MQSKVRRIHHSPRTSYGILASFRPSPSTQRNLFGKCRTSTYKQAPPLHSSSLSGSSTLPLVPFFACTGHLEDLWLRQCSQPLLTKKKTGTRYSPLNVSGMYKRNWPLSIHDSETHHVNRVALTLVSLFASPPDVSSARQRRGDDGSMELGAVYCSVISLTRLYHFSTKSYVTASDVTDPNRSSWWAFLMPPHTGGDGQRPESDGRSHRDGIRSPIS